MVLLICAIMLLGASIAIALIMASPLYRTLSITIDNWADEVHGQDAEQLR